MNDILRRVHLDKIASVTKRLELSRNAVIGSDIPAKAGTVVAGRVLNSKTGYNSLEDVHGRFVTLHPGDVIAGALGRRDALYGYSGSVPEKVEVGDVLDVLNLGGVIGVGAQAAPGIGEAFHVEILGSVLEFPHLNHRVGIPACVERAALAPVELPKDLPPVVTLLGTSMDSGKTTAAAVMIAELTRRGSRVAAGKLTGVALRRDILAMQDCGAEPVALFTDFGVVTTDEKNAVAATHSLLGHLAESDPDIIVLEMGDGLLGTYGVNALLEDQALRGVMNNIVLCAQDPVGAWGAVQLLKDRYGLEANLVSGRVTDTPVGRRYCTEQLGIPAWNALLDGPDEVIRFMERACAQGAL
jgi:hypothetical protein